MDREYLLASPIINIDEDYRPPIAKKLVILNNEKILKNLGFIPKKTKQRKKIKKLQTRLKARVSQLSYDKENNKTQAGILRSKLLSMHKIK